MAKKIKKIGDVWQITAQTNHDEEYMTLYVQYAFAYANNPDLFDDLQVDINARNGTVDFFLPDGEEYDIRGRDTVFVGEYWSFIVEYSPDELAIDVSGGMGKAEIVKNPAREDVSCVYVIYFKATDPFDDIELDESALDVF